MAPSELDIGMLRVARYRAGRGRVRGSCEWAPVATEVPRVCVVVQFEGRATVQQGNRHLRLTPESWALWNVPGPSRIRCEGRYDQVALLFPLRELGCTPGLGALDGMPHSGHSGLGRLVLESVRALAGDMPRKSTADAPILAQLVLRLLRLHLDSPRVRRCAIATSLSEK